ncbi:MAG: dynamin family protein [Peptostreptococcaceae bacterium]
MSNINIEEILNKLKSINTMVYNSFYEEIDDLEKMYVENTFKVVVLGEFSSGKSTFLNALMGRRILYSDMDEATGMTTTIKNSNRNIATINFEDDEIHTISMNTDNFYKELSDYLNINKQNNKKVHDVHIQYEFNNIEEDVIFVDTPGLKGISDEQLNITKDAIKEANAVIFLITEKGLSETELNLLFGRDEKFGNIKTKEVFVLINKIGTVYDIKSEFDANSYIEKVICNVKNTLKENNLDIDNVLQ